MNAPQRLLLDTCVISQFTYRYPSRELITWISQLPDDFLAISVATIFELQRGIEKLRACGSPRTDALEKWLNTLIESDIICLKQDILTARIYARLASCLKLRHLWVPVSHAKNPKLGQDLMIAATAIRHQIPIATMNYRDFILINEYFSLPGVLDPLTKMWHVPLHAQPDLNAKPEYRENILQNF